MSKKISLFLVVIMIMTAVLAMPTFAYASDEVASENGEAQTEATNDLIGNVETVEATLYSSEAVTVKWDGVEEAKGYAVYQVESKDDQTEYEPIKYIGDAEAQETKVTGVEKGVKHTYAVRAFTYENENSEEKVFSDEYKEDSIYMPKVINKKSKGYKDTNAAKVIKLAETKIGSRYVSGAEGPTRFDCSGFVWYVMEKTEVSNKSFTRSSAAGTYASLRQYDIGSKSLSQAQPGDMVFFAPGGSISHVAFYYGDGKLIHATNPRDGVRVTEARYFGRIAGIVRLPNL
ncbi:MAG: C40 family peptidase [Anaerovoracaceae bacterium]